MNNDEKLKQIIEALYAGFDSAALLSIDKDGSLNVIKEEKSSYDFIVYEKHCDFEELINKFIDLGYEVDLDTFRGLIHVCDLIKVDVANKRVTRPLIVSPNHYHYLRDEGSILLVDLLNNFDEVVIKENKALLESLTQGRKNEQSNKWIKTTFS